MIASQFSNLFFRKAEAHCPTGSVAQLINEVFTVAPLLLKHLNNYEYRARILWASTVALNGTLYAGRKTSGDWGVHSIGHVSFRICLIHRMGRPYLLSIRLGLNL